MKNETIKIRMTSKTKIVPGLFGRPDRKVDFFTYWLPCQYGDTEIQIDSDRYNFIVLQKYGSDVTNCAVGGYKTLEEAQKNKKQGTAIAEVINEKTFKDKIIESDVLLSYNDWVKEHHDRTYFTLKGHDQNFAGCRSAKIWIDNKTDELHIDLGKGVAPNEWNNSLDVLKKIK